MSKLSLPIWCNPIREDESLLSLMTRTAFRNGISLSGLTKIIFGAHQKYQSAHVSFLIDEEQISKLSYVLNINADYIRSKSMFKLDKYRRSFIRKEVHATQLLQAQRSICVKCIEDIPHHQDVWHLRDYSVCTEHEISMISVCPECTRSILWSITTISHCSCGYDLRRSPVARDEDGLYISKWIKTSLYDEEPYFPEFLRFLSLGEKIHQIHARTKRYKGNRGYFSQNNASTKNIAEILKSFENWPYNYVDFHIKKHKSSYDGLILRSRLKSIYRNSFIKYIPFHHRKSIDDNIRRKLEEVSVELCETQRDIIKKFHKIKNHP